MLLKLFPNPYHVLDHEHRLAGALPEAQGNRPSFVMPHRRHIGAELLMTEGSYTPDSDAHGQPDVQSTSDTWWKFSVEPVVVDATDPKVRAYYVTSIRDGEVFACEDGNPPLVALARARAKAIDHHELKLTSAQLPIEMWRHQFALDEQVESTEVPVEKTAEPKKEG
jgi:hypothetical protein